jgi:hypothetical protein
VQDQCPITHFLTFDHDHLGFTRVRLLRRKMAATVHDNNGHNNPPLNDDTDVGGGPPSGDFTMEMDPRPSLVVPHTPVRPRKRAASPQASPAKHARMNAGDELVWLRMYLRNVSEPAPATSTSWVKTTTAMIQAIHEGITNIRRLHMGERTGSTEGSGNWDEAIRSVSLRLKTIVDDSVYPLAQSIQSPNLDDPMNTEPTPAGLNSSAHAPGGHGQRRLTPPGPADSAVMEVLKEMQGEMRAMRGEVSSLRNRLSAFERPSSLSSAASHSQVRPTTYATTAAINTSQKPTNAPLTSPTAPSPSKNTDASKKLDAAKLPVEVVVAFGENKLPPELRHAPEVIVEEINREFHRMPTSSDLTVLGAQWTMTGNCKLSFLPGTNTKKVCAPAHLDVIRRAASNGRNVIIEPNTKWSKFAVNGVLVRDSDGQIFSEDTLNEALRLNPFFADTKIRIMQKPRFTKRADEITSFRSSISFAILDPDGSLGRRLMKQPLFMFGSPVTIREWRDKPQLTQCKRCWVLGHTLSNCREKDACRECGSKTHHTTTDHRKKCQQCQGVDASIPCSHFRCVNCKGGHTADSLDCPERRKYRVPVAEPSRKQTLMDVA